MTRDYDVLCLKLNINNLVYRFLSHKIFKRTTPKIYHYLFVY